MSIDEIGALAHFTVAYLAGLATVEAAGPGYPEKEGVKMGAIIYILYALKNTY